jgi:hypothetical protein
MHIDALQHGCARKFTRTYVLAQGLRVRIASRYAADVWARDEAGGRSGTILTVDDPSRGTDKSKEVCTVLWDRNDERSWGPGRSHELKSKYTGTYRCGPTAIGGGHWLLALAPDQISVDHEAIAAVQTRQRDKTVQAATGSGQPMDWLFSTQSDGADEAQDLAERCTALQKDLDELGEQLQSQISDIVDMCEDCVEEAQSALDKGVEVPTFDAPTETEDAKAKVQSESDDSPLTVNVTLDLDFDAVAGDPGSDQRASFTKALNEDLAKASAGMSSLSRAAQQDDGSPVFEISNLQAGSVTFDVKISCDLAGIGPKPSAVLESLKKQAGDPSSTLRAGKLTRALKILGDETFDKVLEEKKVGEEAKKVWDLIAASEEAYRKKVEADEALHSAMKDLDNHVEPSHTVFCVMAVPELVRKLEKIYGAGKKSSSGRQAGTAGGRAQAFADQVK